MKEIDVKEDHLLIYRDNDDGGFLRFEWHYADKYNKDDLMERIKKYNASDKVDINGYIDYVSIYTPADMKTRRICACIERTITINRVDERMNEIIKKTESLGDEIDEIVSKLKNASVELESTKDDIDDLIDKIKEA